MAYLGYNPFAPPDPNNTKDPRNRGDGGGGLLALPFALPLMLPVFLMVGGILYPITGIATGITWFIAFKTAQLFSLTGWALKIASSVPAAIVMWIVCRWDTRMGEKTIYRRIRHLVRLLLLGLLMVLLSNVDGPKNLSDHEIFSRFFHNRELWGVSAVILIVFHLMAINNHGVVKSFWRALLEILRLRPNLGT